MGHLRDDEVRRLLTHLRRHVSEQEWLAEIEDLLRSDEAEEYLREPELLDFFPPINEEILVREERWILRIIPHAHLRIVQRGISSAVVADIFRRFIDYSYASDEVISIGHKKIIDPRSRSGAAITLRADVDEVDDVGGRAHVVTVILGHTSSNEDTDVVTL